MKNECFKQYHDNKKVREFYKSDAYKVFENAVNSEVLGMIQRANILTLFGSISNYFIAVGMRRILEMIKSMAKNADEFEAKVKRSE